MIGTRTALGAIILGLTVCAGLALAQDRLPQNYNQELASAQQSLEEAMEHLQRIRDPDFPAVDKAYAFMILAHTELETGRLGTRPLRDSSQ